MCMAAIGAIGGIAGGVVSAMGARANAQGEAAAARYNAQVSRNNAISYRNKASYEAGLTYDKGLRIMAEQAVNYGKAGVDVVGTPAIVRGESVEQVDMDVQAAIYAGELDARRETAAAQLYDIQAENAERAGNIAAASAIIGGIGSAFKSFSSSSTSPTLIA